jgi:hypothetical protein
MKRLIFAAIANLLLVWGFPQDFWELITTEPDSTNARSIAISSEGDIYLGMTGFMYPGGIYRSTDNAQTWQYLGFDEKPIYAIEVCSNGDILAGVNNGIYKSTDYGSNWYAVYSEVDNITVIKSLSNGYVFAGGTGNLHGIIRSTDFGETWDTVHVFTNYGQENLKALTVSDEDMIVAGTYNVFGEGSIWFSNDLGEIWTNIETPEFSPYWPWIFSLAVHPQGDLFVGFYGQGLYRYSFTTLEWALLTNPLVTPDDILLVGNYKIFIGLFQDPNGYVGIAYSNDGGQTFEALNSGMNGGNGTSISYLLRNPDNIIYAKGNGLFRSTIPVLTEIENYQAQNKTNTAINKPNPFYSFTHITWGKTNSPEIILTIISVSSGDVIFKGKIVNTGNFLFHANDLEPGVYYYSILDGNNIYSGKMVLIK